MGAAMKVGSFFPELNRQEDWIRVHPFVVIPDGAPASAPRVHFVNSPQNEETSLHYPNNLKF